ncbi:uncharacterized protein LOC144153723 isoform X2 [Haemaphysalis longicornis]
MRSKKQARVYARIGSATLGPAPTLRRYKREPAPSARHTTSHSQRSNFSSRTAAATLKMCSRRVAFSLLCLALVAALMTQEAEASKLKKVAKYALIGAALAPRIVPIPIPIGHHQHYEHSNYGWHAGHQGGHHGWW